MRKTRIYFFSGAGHSFAVARDLASAWENTELINIAQLFSQETISDDTDLIGLIFPVQGGLPPKIIREWLPRFKPDKNSTVFSVCTCGISPGHSLLYVDKTLRESGSRLSWGFAVKQPQSGIGSGRINTADYCSMLLDLQKKKVEEIAQHIASSGVPVLEKGSRVSEFLSPNTLKVMPTLGKLLFNLITKGMKNMQFHPGAACTGCGICAALCPADNIEIINNFPRWGSDCMGCMACYHWCPEDCVENVDLDMIQSPHSEVDVTELLEYSRKQE